MPAAIDLTGHRFGSLVVIDKFKKSKKSTNQKTTWLCKCDCLYLCERSSDYLKSEKQQTKACPDCGKKNHRESGTKHGMSGSSIYVCWQDMRKRCSKKYVSVYKWYGGKGVKVCKDWESFETFLMWAKESGYRDGLSIDRIDSSGDYTPENCQWLTPSENTKKMLKERYG